MFLLTWRFLWQGTPAVMETYIDSKKEVDSHLKRTCEEFIHSITQAFVGPLINFLTKVCHNLLSLLNVLDVLEKSDLLWF